MERFLRNQKEFLELNPIDGKVSTDPKGISRLKNQNKPKTYKCEIT